MRPRLVLFNTVLVALACSDGRGGKNPSRTETPASLEAADFKGFLANERLVPAGSLTLRNTGAPPPVGLPSPSELRAPGRADVELHAEIVPFPGDQVVIAVGPFQEQDLEPAFFVFIHCVGPVPPTVPTSISVFESTCVARYWRKNVAGSISLSEVQSGTLAVDLALDVTADTSRQRLVATVPLTLGPPTAWSTRLIQGVADPCNHSLLER